LSQREIAKPNETKQTPKRRRENRKNETIGNGLFGASVPGRREQPRVGKGVVVADLPSPLVSTLR